MFCPVCNHWHPRYATSAACMVGAGDSGDRELEEELAAWDEASNEALYNFEEGLEEEENGRVRHPCEAAGRPLA